MNKAKALFKLHIGNDFLKYLNQVNQKSVKCDHIDPFSQVKGIIIFVCKSKLWFGKLERQILGVKSESKI